MDCTCDGCHTANHVLNSCCARKSTRWRHLDCRQQQELQQRFAPVQHRRKSRGTTPAEAPRQPRVPRVPTNLSGSSVTASRPRRRYSHQGCGVTPIVPYWSYRRKGSYRGSGSSRGSHLEAPDMPRCISMAPGEGSACVQCLSSYRHCHAEQSRAAQGWVGTPGGGTEVNLV